MTQRGVKRVSNSLQSNETKHVLPRMGLCSEEIECVPPNTKQACRTALLYIFEDTGPRESVDVAVPCLLWFRAKKPMPGQMAFVWGYVSWREVCGTWSL